MHAPKLRGRARTGQPPGCRRPGGPETDSPPATRATAASDESGQLLPLIIGFGIIIILLCTVVFDAAQVFVYRRALRSIADGAALAATNGINKSAIYSSGVSDRVELSQQLAQEEVSRYIADGGYRSLTCTADVGAADVTVACNGTVELPIVNSISGNIGRIRVYVDSTAETFTGP